MESCEGPRLRAHSVLVGSRVRRLRCHVYSVQREWVRACTLLVYFYLYIHHTYRYIIRIPELPKNSKNLLQWAVLPAHSLCSTLAPKLLENSDFRSSHSARWTSDRTFLCTFISSSLTQLRVVKNQIFFHAYMENWEESLIWQAKQKLFWKY